MFRVRAMCSGDPAFDFRSERPVVLRRFSCCLLSLSGT